MTEDNVIIDEEEMFEAIGGDPDEYEDGLSATKAPVREGMEFHVQMTGYRLSDFEDAVIQAAARSLLSKAADDGTIGKRIQDACVDMLNDKINTRLEAVTSDIMDKPMVPNFGDKEPVTMREFIGLMGRDFLEQKVDGNGKKSTGGWGSNSVPRIDYLVEKLIDRKFRSEIDKAVIAMTNEVRGEMRKAMDGVIAEQKAKIQESVSHFLKT